MITVTKGKVTWPNKFHDRQLPNVCLYFAGGGMTPNQTAKAMIAQGEVLRCGVTKLNGFKIVMTTEDEANAT